jgi:putative membrane protein
MLRREHLPHLFGVTTLAFIFSAASVHPQTPSDSAGSGATSSKPMGGSSSTATGTTDQSSSAGKSTGGGSVSKTDRDLMREIAYANLDEIEAGKLAQSKSKNDQVKSFAQKMIDDHTKAMGELQQLAQAKGVTLPTEPDVKHKAMMKKLSALSDAEFDRMYVAQGGVTDHRNTHRLLQRVQARAKDPDLKALAAKTIPTVDQHLTLAQDLSGGKPGAKSASGTSGTSGGSSGAGTSGGTAAPSGSSPSGGTSK